MKNVVRRLVIDWFLLFGSDMVLFQLIQECKSIHTCNRHSHSCNKPKNSTAKIIVPLLQVFNEKIQGSKKNYFYEDHNAEIISCDNPDKTAFRQPST